MVKDKILFNHYQRNLNKLFFYYQSTMAEWNFGLPQL